MANVKNNSAAQDTRRRLLNAAGEVFAERGLHGATTKQITDRAGASLASVNYHFRDKAELYAAVLKQIADDSSIIVPPTLPRTLPPETRLREFLRHLCVAATAKERPIWKQLVLAREWEQPSPALEPLFRQIMKPLTDGLSKLVSELMGRRVGDVGVGLIATSILGQCVFFMKHQRQIRLANPQLSERLTGESFAEHVANFSLGGIAYMRQKASPNLRRSTKAALR